MLNLEHLTKSYGPNVVLRDFTLQLEAGRTYVLIGPSGCGKSTVLRLLAALIYPDHGRIEFDGRTLTPQSARELRLRMGYVIQEGGLFPHLTARQNASLMPRHLKWEPGRIRQRIADLAALMHLDDSMLSRYPAQLSGGQRQRISLMRALMMDPDVLILDEPLGALDPMIRAQLQDELKELFLNLKKTVVLVTHDLAEAAYLGDRLFLMRDGAIVQSGSANDLVNSPADEFVAAFVSAQRRL